MCVLSDDPIKTTLKAMRDRGVRAYLLIENPSYDGSGNLIYTVKQMAKPLGFEANRTAEYLYSSLVEDFMSQAGVALEKLIESYGANQTAGLCNILRV